MGVTTAGASHSVLARASGDAGEPAQPRVSPARCFAERRRDPETSAAQADRRWSASSPRS